MSAVDEALDRARAFIEAAPWTFAKTYARFAPHEYTVRQQCRAQRLEAGFDDLAQLIEEAGFWRSWGGHRWRTIVIDDQAYWLYRVWVPVNERTVINRWHADQLDITVDEQLQLDV
jgi:hypothetical protein